MQKITFEDLPSTNTPINATNLNTVQTNVENAITPTLLWENQSPSVAFSAQTITLSSDDYDELEFVFKETKNSNYLYVAKTLKGYGTRLATGFTPADVGVAFYSREVIRTNDTQYSISQARYYYGNNTKGELNDLIIPIAVYGIKH